MTVLDFRENIVTPRLEAIKKTLLQKGEEYIRNDNPFHNFDKGAIRNDTIPEDILWSFMEKHMISLDDIINDIINHKEIYEKEVNEKIGDIICYLILLEGLLKRRLWQQISKI